MDETTADCKTIHSGENSNDLYIHFIDRLIDYYKNQLIFRISGFTTTIIETLFDNQQRIIFTKLSFSKEDILSLLKQYHNGKQSAIMAPEPIMLKPYTQLTIINRWKSCLVKENTKSYHRI